MEAKKPWQSKTLVLNGLMGLLSFVFLFHPVGEHYQAVIQNHLGEIGMAWSVLNMVLRTVTKDKISLSE
jgi:hypothetical protein